MVDAVGGVAYALDRVELQLRAEDEGGDAQGVHVDLERVVHLLLPRFYLVQHRQRRELHRRDMDEKIGARVLRTEPQRVLEIAELVCIFGDKDILEFDISVRDAPPLQSLQRVDDLAEELEDLLLSEGLPVLGSLERQLVQVLLAVLHKDEEALHVGRANAFDEPRQALVADNVRVVQFLHHSEYFDFSGHLLNCEVVQPELLDHYQLLRVSLAAEVHTGLTPLDVPHELQVRDVVVVEFGDRLASLPIIHFTDYIITKHPSIDGVMFRRGDQL